jgi:hypothetical protein
MTRVTYTVRAAFVIFQTPWQLGDWALALTIK